ncbi:sensor histidine kinase [Solidesulfovibrio sp.]|uniref:sensor histidine kinase n=1 Tax=Solidesulfovibrio sp. TaxID=2910990 RepID=UPI0026381B46|nr:sensor histidine kinase [Solidesulfovibrio sp.]
MLDLSGWAPTRDGPVALAGEWEFYWDRLLAPEDFTAGLAPPSGYMRFPGFWKGQALDGQPLPGEGQATFRLRLAPGTDAGPLAVRIVGVSAAYRLWANGKLVAASGVVGESAATETPHRSLVLARFESDGSPVELVLQVSNHYYGRGGMQNPLRLGLPEQLEKEHIRIWAFAMFFVGSLLVMTVYHFALYFLRKKDASPLYFGFGCLVIIGVYVTLDASDWLVELFLPQADPLVVGKIALICFAVLASVLYRFYRSLYPDEFIVFIQYVCDIRSVVFVCIILTQPGIVIYGAMRWLAVVTIFLNACFLVMLVLCLKHGRDGARILFLGYILLSVTSLSDIYRNLFTFNTMHLLPVGMLAFVLSQALAMAQRFSTAFKSVENLSQALEANNAVLLAEMDERTRLEREIVNVSEEERRRLSHDLHDGLCQQLSGARLRCSALERRSIAEPGVAEEVSDLSLLLEDSVSQAYDLSRGLWPVEHALGDVGPSLAELARRVGQSSGVEVAYREDLGCAPCRNEHLVQFYRIAQEAVANAVKHARPTRIDITLACGPDRRLTLAVRDDGVGRRAARPTGGGLGLRIMAYRARMIGAELSIDDGAAGGTVVSCFLACAADGTRQEGADE